MQIVIKISLYFLEMDDAENSTSWLLSRFIFSLSRSIYLKLHFCRSVYEAKLNNTVESQWQTSGSAKKTFGLSKESENRSAENFPVFSFYLILLLFFHRTKYHDELYILM